MRKFFWALTALLLAAAPAVAQVKIGFVTTLSGPGGYLGEDMRDGFMLAVRDGTLGGVAVSVLVEDDGLKPAQAKQIVQRQLKSHDVLEFSATCSLL